MTREDGVSAIPLGKWPTLVQMPVAMSLDGRATFAYPRC
jgi:hypothetical protein